MFRFCLYKIGQFCVALLPLPASFFLAKLICDGLYFFNTTDRRAIEGNFRKILPEDADIKKLSRQVFRNFGLYLVEFFCMRRLVSEKFLKEKVIIENRQVLEEVASVGQGGVVLSAHLGNWELGAVLLSKLGYPLTVIALAHNQRSVNDLFNRQRGLCGNKIAQLQNAFRECTETLKKNGLIGLVADRDFAGTGLPVGFLGHSVRLPVGPALFSLKFGAPIIPTFLTRETGGKYKLRFEDPIWPRERVESPSQEKLKESMLTYIHIFEEKIRQYPAQWLVFRDFTQP